MSTHQITIYILEKHIQIKKIETIESDCLHVRRKGSGNDREEIVFKKHDTTLAGVA